MKLTVKGVKIDKQGVIKNHGLETGGRIEKFMASELQRMCDPYVPMQDGNLKNNVFVGENYVRYPGPYAHFQYVGKVMVGEKSSSPWARHGERKKYTGKGLTYNGGPIRGPEWDKRMLIDRGKEYAKNVATRAGGTTK